MKTVYELIQELAKYPSDMRVEFAITDGSYDKYIGISTVEEASFRRSVLIRADIEYKDLED